MELPDKLTPVTKEDLIQAMWHAWVHYFGSVPTKESVWVVVAQTWLETGLKYCHNYNLGNVKSREGDGFDYQFFACNEVLSAKQAQAMVEASPDTVKITRYQGNGMAVTWFYPKHPGCRFRAFGTLQEGAVDHLSLVAGRFSKAWPHVVSGDVIAYSKALKAQRYYTADETTYTKGIKRCFDALSKLDIDYTALPTMTEEEVRKIKGLVALTQQSLVDGLDLHSDES